MNGSILKEVPISQNEWRKWVALKQTSIKRFTVCSNEQSGVLMFTDSNKSVAFVQRAFTGKSSELSNLFLTQQSVERCLKKCDDVALVHGQRGETEG